VVAPAPVSVKKHAPHENPAHFLPQENADQGDSSGLNQAVAGASLAEPEEDGPKLAGQCLLSLSLPLLQN